MEQPIPPTPTPPVIPTPPPVNWRLFLELLAFAFFVFPPFGSVIGPLVLWLVKKDVDPVVNHEGKKVLNYNLSWTIWMIVSCGIGSIPWMIITIIASLKAANNEPFKHPWTLTFLK